MAQTEYSYDDRCVQSPDTLNGMKILTVVDQLPGYRDGMDVFCNEISKLITYPKERQRRGIDTKFIFTFVVDTLGNMRSFCLIKPEDSLINQDSLGRLSKWIPGEQDGNKVPVRLTIPMIIELR